GTDIDDGTSVVSKEPQRLLSREYRPKNIHIEVLTEAGFGNALDWTEVVHAGVVDEHVESAIRGLGVREQPAYIDGLGHVCLDGNGSASGTDDVPNDCIRRGTIGRVVDDHRGTRGREGPRNSRADSPGRAGDDGNLVLQCFHGFGL